MSKLSEIFKKNGILLTKNQEKLFDLYFSHLIETNKKFNLTAITDENEVIVKHFLDSILPYKNIKNDAKVVDVGSGAGFPGIPLKIMRDDLSICMIDSLQKRINFLNETIQMLNFHSCTAVHSRVEDFCVKNREVFDVAVARAVAPLNTLVEYLLPLIRVGGQALIYKSVKMDEELELAQSAIKILGGKVKKIEYFTVNSYNSEIFDRKILIIEKVLPTPKKFPRSGNKAKTQPIQ